MWKLELYGTKFWVMLLSTIVKRLILTIVKRLISTIVKRLILIKRSRFSVHPYRFLQFRVDSVDHDNRAFFTSLFYTSYKKYMVALLILKCMSPCNISSSLPNIRDKFAYNWSRHIICVFSHSWDFYLLFVWLVFNSGSLVIHPTLMYFI